MESIFFHIDVNSAFLSWTAIDQLQKAKETDTLDSYVDLRDIPSIIGGDSATRHGIVLAIPAKKYGISTAEPIASALKKCPSLVIASPDHHSYSAHSHALMEFLSGYCPVIEQVSIDECYMDYTPICRDFESPQAAATIIKDSVRETFGFTVNVGISDRKVLAKRASDFKKPDLVHTLYAKEIQTKMWPLPVRDLFMVGHASAAKLELLGIKTIGDLAKAVQQLFGDTGTRVIGTRHGEKLYETLMTKEERMRSEDMGNYYRVAADNRDLNYDKYFLKGQVHTQADEDYTSHNTRRLDVEGTIKKIMTTEYIQEALKEAGKA